MLWWAARPTFGLAVSLRTACRVAAPCPASFSSEGEHFWGVGLPNYLNSADLAVMSASRLRFRASRHPASEETR